jgi:hypothetical protein
MTTMLRFAPVLLSLGLFAALLASPATARTTQPTPRSHCLDVCTVQYYADEADCVSQPHDMRKDCRANASDARKGCRAGCPKSSHSTRRR